MNFTAKSSGRRAIIGAVLAALSLPTPLLAQGSNPGKVIRVVVPFGAGSSPDIIARFWGDRLAKSLGQPVVIDNKPGASTIIGAQAVATAPADGHTLLYTVNNTTSINPTLYKTLPYRADDFVPVTRILSVPYVLVVAANSPIKTLPDLIAAAKSRPGELNYASYGIGQGTHVAMAWFLNSTGLFMTHVPYKDGGVTDIINGQVTALFDATTTAIPQIKGGRLRALAVSGPRRVDALPGVPAVSETVPGFIGDSWHGVLVLKGTPQAAIDRLVTASREIVASEEFRKKLHDLGLVPVGSTQEEFAKFLTEDARAWGKVLSDNKISAD